MNEFLAMGGYARWVWSAFGLTAVVLFANVVVARANYQRTLRDVQMWVEDQLSRDRS